MHSRSLTSPELLEKAEAPYQQAHRGRIRRSPTTTPSSSPTRSRRTDCLPDEAKVYDLVAWRFLAVFFPAARFENTTVVTEVRKRRLPRARRAEAGWRALYP